MLIKDILLEENSDLLYFKQDVESCMTDSLDGLTNLPSAINYYIEKGNIPIPKMAKVINKYKNKILDALEDNYYLIDRTSIFGSISKLNLNWPELTEIELKLIDEIVELEAPNALKEMHFSRSLITNHKDKLIKFILHDLKTGDQEISEIMVKKLLEQGVNWPELAIIKRSIEADSETRNLRLNENSDINRAPKSVQDAAIARNGNVLQFIRNPTPDQIQAAIKQTGEAIRFVKNPTPDQQIAAVISDGKAIKYIKDPHPDLQMIAVNKDPMSIQYIENPPENVQLAAINKNIVAFYEIENPTDRVLMAGWLGGLPIIQRIESKDTSFFEQHKASFMKKLLKYIKDTEYTSATYLYRFAKSKDLNWPELDIIKKSLDGLKPKWA